MTKPIAPLVSLLNYSRVHRGKIYWAVTCSLLNKIFDLAPPALIGLAVDVVIKQQDSFLARWGIVAVESQLLALTVVSAVIWALESIFEYAYERLWRNLAQDIQHDLRLDAYAHLQQLDLAYFEERSTGRLMAILNDDINQLERFLDVGANEILQVLTTVVVIGGAFFVITPDIAWMAVVPMPFVLLGSIYFQSLLTSRYALVREKVSNLNSRLSNNLSGIMTIKSFATETEEVERLRQDSDAYRDSNQRAIALSAAFVPLIRVIIFVGFSTILYFGGLDAVRGNLAVGSYSMLVFLTQRLLWPLTGLGKTLDLYQRAMASTQRVMKLLATPIQAHPGELSLHPSQVQGELIFQNISFAYPHRPAVLKDVSLKVPAGQTIGIVGATGSGKSTLVKLLLRLYEWDSGDILLDGVDLRKYFLGDLRRSIGLVSQDVFLFHGTVRENIAYGSADATLTQIERAANLAEAEEFIRQLPQGYDTIIGERGQKLSGGQRQRLAIARAILKNSPILILDEATSAVDNETEAAIVRSLEKITKNRTTITIAHRLSTVRYADQIYVLENGMVEEMGNHDSLLARQGIYAKLWRVQTGLRSGVS
ncbi:MULTISPECIES: ABC transporter ATP-binding protein [unclassified Synechocystis]|uniref:ABC transporter ATP-binding protein n=1 Tax=unclassified Synechocystis TaxID=2640012 RepID=UPI00041D7D0E|nr:MULTISPECIES: ABC transporter ATP-binding protein [unclassified Synechocystis]AIE74268.1 ABC transporter, transmembrane region:ABC transporter [Synechocystis sp. PCC 6714]MCT0254940.1 ABC transporter ATP-binding protein/permease [Synechocystis sp. CS-94]